MSRKSISRDGMSLCTSCGGHVDVSQGPPTRCPICAALWQGRAKKDGWLRHPALQRGRSGLVVASLFGLTALGGCAKNPATPDGTQEASGDGGVERVVSENPPEQLRELPSEMMPDPGIMQPYGLPPEPSPEPSTDAGPEATPEASTDAGAEATPETGADSGPVDNGPLPPYGIPPDR